MPRRSRAGVVVAVRVARALYQRWEGLAPGQRAPLASLAGDVKERALELRGSADPDGARHGLGSASRDLAQALGDAAARDPELSATDVNALRAELRRELERLEQRRAA